MGERTACRRCRLQIRLTTASLYCVFGASGLIWRAGLAREIRRTGDAFAAAIDKAPDLFLQKAIWDF